MPNQDPEIVKQWKHEWYVKNREEILKQKQQRWVEKKKAQQPRERNPHPPHREQDNSTGKRK